MESRPEGVRGRSLFILETFSTGLTFSVDLPPFLVGLSVDSEDGDFLSPPDSVASLTFGACSVGVSLALGSSGV